MTDSGYVLVFHHSFAIARYAALAESLKERNGLRAYLWVVDEKSEMLGRKEPVFDEVCHVLAGFDRRRIDDDYDANLVYLQQFEAAHPWATISNDISMDRVILGRGWPRALIVAYASHLLRQMQGHLERWGGPPVMALGPNDGLHGRLGHHVVGPQVPFVHFANVRHWPDRVHWEHGDMHQWPAFRATYRQFMASGTPAPLKQQAAERLARIRANRITPPYAPVMKDRAEGERLHNKLKLQRIRRHLEQVRFKRHHRGARWNPRTMPRREFSTIVRGIRYLRWLWASRRYYNLCVTRVAGGSRYAVCFLHHQPENIVDGPGFPYRDQLPLVENIAAALPVDMTLFVKEQSTSRGRRPRGYYERLVAVPNVTLISDRLESYDLIKNSAIVFTLVGTAALEALFLGVPSILFGHIYFDEVAGIEKVDSYWDLPNAVQSALDGVDPALVEQSAVAYLAATYVASTPGKLSSTIYDDREMFDPANIENLVRPLQQIIDERIKPAEIANLVPSLPSE